MLGQLRGRRQRARGKRNRPAVEGKSESVTLSNDGAQGVSTR